MKCHQVWIYIVWNPMGESTLKKCNYWN